MHLQRASQVKPRICLCLDDHVVHCPLQVQALLEQLGGANRDLRVAKDAAAQYKAELEEMAAHLNDINSRAVRIRQILVFQSILIPSVSYSY